MGTNAGRIGEQAFANSEKANGELLALMYGSLVTQLIKDTDDIEAVNSELSKLGFGVGLRLIEEFLAKTDVSGCSDFRETCEVIAKIGIKMFLGVNASVNTTLNKGQTCTIQIPYNPMTEFVELPARYEEIKYCNFLCGIIKGALEQIHIKVNCEVTKDVLKGDETNEIRLDLVEILRDEFVDLEDRG